MQRRARIDDNYYVYSYVSRRNVTVFIGVGHTKQAYEVPSNVKLQVMVARGDVEFIKLSDIGLTKGEAGVKAAKLITKLRPSGQLFNSLHHTEDRSGALAMFVETLNGLVRVDTTRAYA